MTRNDSCIAAFVVGMRLKALHLPKGSAPLNSTQVVIAGHILRKLGFRLVG